MASISWAVQTISSRKERRTNKPTNKHTHNFVYDSWGLGFIFLKFVHQIKVTEEKNCLKKILMVCHPLAL